MAIGIVVLAFLKSFTGTSPRIVDLKKETKRHDKNKIDRICFDNVGSIFL